MLYNHLQPNVDSHGKAFSITVWAVVCVWLRRGEGVGIGDQGATVPAKHINIVK